MNRCMFITSAMFLSLAGCAGFYTGATSEYAGSQLVAPPRQPHTLRSSGALSATDIATLAIENSLELRAEKGGLEARAGAWRLGFSGFLPRVEASAGSDERLSVYSTDSFTRNLSVSIAQPVWDGGRLVTARALESAGIALASAELERKAIALGEQAIAASRAVLSAGARFEIKRTSRASAIIQHAILMTEIELGLAKALDLLEVETSLAELDIEIAKAELELATAKSELAEALCVDQLPELSERLVRDKPILSLDAGRVCALVVERSPELALARHSLMNKRAEYTASRFSWLPTISIKLSGIASGTEYPLTRATWSAGTTIDFSSPYLSGSGSIQLGGDPPGSATARINDNLKFLPDPARSLSSRQAQLAFNLERDRYPIEVQRMERSARTALAIYENAAHSRDAGARLLELAETRLRMMELSVGLGQAVRSDLIKSELERATSEIELVDAVAALEVAERGLETMLDIPPASLAAFFEVDAGATP